MRSYPKSPSEGVASSSSSHSRRGHPHEPLSSRAIVPHSAPQRPRSASPKLRGGRRRKTTPEKFVRTQNPVPAAGSPSTRNEICRYHDGDPYRFFDNFDDFQLAPQFLYQPEAGLASARGSEGGPGRGSAQSG